MKQKEILLLLTGLMLLVMQLSAQSKSKGNVKIVQDVRVENLLTLHAQCKATHPEIDGYKIQIFMDLGNDAVERANAVVENFSMNFPDSPVDLTYGAPYYRVRVGNFRSRIEAEGLLKRILPLFSQAFITKDKIKP